MPESKSQIYAAIIAACIAIAIALGGFLWTNGRHEGHLISIGQREDRLETKLDAVYEEVIKLREDNARIKERLRIGESLIGESLSKRGQ